MITWEDFLLEVERCGFEIISLRPYEYNGPTETGLARSIHDLIAAHREKKLILHSTSYASSGGVEALNGGRVYGTIDKGKASIRQLRSALTGCYYDRGIDPPLAFNFSVSLITLMLRELGDRFQLVDWNDPNRAVSLLDPLERKTGDLDFSRRKWDEFIASAPDWVRSFILK